MKYIISLITLVFILSSCFGSSTWVDETGLSEQDLWTFSILTPDSWETMDIADLPEPKAWEIVYGVSSVEQREGYLNNIVVLKSENTKNESSASLMKNNANFLNSSLDNFKVISEENIVFADQQQGVLLTFSWKYNRNTPEITYLQTARSCDDASYFITLSLAEKLESYDRYAYLLKSFECK